jgi:predicted RNA-binding protein YlxR (DUF448 family)
MTTSITTTMSKTKNPPRPRLRRCVACREMREKHQLARIVRTPDGAIQPDPTGKAPGRGAYICKTDACTARAKKIKGLERSFSRAVPSEVYEKVGAY